MPPVPNSSGGDFTIRSLSELSGTQTKHWPLDGLGSVINKKNGGTTIVPVRKKLTDVALPTTQRQRQGGAEQLSPARYSKARITKPPEQHWKLHILSQHASVCKLGKASGRWYCSVCVCVCARWKGGFVLAIDCGPVRSNVSGLTQTNTDVEAVKKKKGWLGVFGASQK